MARSPIAHINTSQLRNMVLTLVCLLGFFPLHADVGVWTEALGLTEGESCELAGSIRLEINDDDFADASATNPYYIRISTDSEVTLCHGLVPPLGTNTVPIYLAMVVERSPVQTLPTMLAPSDSVSIVRWDEAASEIWICISSSSSTWIEVDGQSGPPTADLPVQVWLGIAGAHSSDWAGPHHATGQANLPFNTPNAATTGDPDDIAGTELELDVSNPILEAGGPVGVDFIAYSETVGVSEPGSVTNVGQTLSIDFTSNWGTMPLIGFIDGISGQPGGVQVSAEPNEIYYQGTQELAGSLSFGVIGDDFPDAGPNEPVYIRITLSSDAVLAETLVDGNNPDLPPIFLALSLETEDPSALMGTSPNAVSIVRWMAGENALWLRVTESSSDWIHYPNSFSVPPSEDLRVNMTLGVTAAESWGVNQPPFLVGLASLPANSTRPFVPTMGDAASTSLYVDVSQSTLEPGGGVNSSLLIDPIAYVGSTGVETEADPGNISVGTIAPIDFVGTSIAVAFGIEVSISPAVAVQGPGPVTMQAVVDPAITIVEYKWTDADSGDLLSAQPMVLWEPIPERNVSVRLEVRDNLGRIGYAEGQFLVTPEPLDPNADGLCTEEDLLFMLPSWNITTCTVRDLLTINTGN